MAKRSLQLQEKYREQAEDEVLADDSKRIIKEIEETLLLPYAEIEQRVNSMSTSKYS